MITDTNSNDRLVQSLAEHLEQVLRWIDRCGR